jgi:antitoxin ChpS
LEDPLHTAKLRTVGGSTMVAIPPAVLEALKLAPKAEVYLRVDGNKLVIEPKHKRRGRIGLKARIAMCNPDAPLSADDEAELQLWMNLKPIGREII